MIGCIMEAPMSSSDKAGEQESSVDGHIEDIPETCPPGGHGARGKALAKSEQLAGADDDDRTDRQCASLAGDEIRCPEGPTDPSLITFVRAVYKKYNRDNCDLEKQGFSKHVLYVPKSGPVKVTDSGSIMLPNHVSMSGQEIACAGSSGQIRRMCSKVAELDLMENKIKSWAEVFAIIECIPTLTFLNLTKNPLTLDPSDFQGQQLPGLTHLVLNNTGVTWKALHTLFGLFTGLEELHLSLNGFHTFDIPTDASASDSLSDLATNPSSFSMGSQHETPEHEMAPLETLLEHHSPENRSPGAGTQQSHTQPETISQQSKDVNSGMHRTNEDDQNVRAATQNSDPDVPSAGNRLAYTITKANKSQITCYPSLKRLFFVGNNITDWGEFNKLGLFFPCLEFLLVSETAVTCFGDESKIAASFPCLKTIGLNRCALESWEEVEKLRRFPALADVRLAGIPLLENLPEKLRRQHTIALLPNISMLNGSPISPTEREDSERAFIRRNMDKEVKGNRFYELESQYGKLDPLVNLDLKPVLKVLLTIKLEDAEGNLIKTEEMAVDTTQTIREFRKLLSNVAGLPATKIQLYYLEKNLANYPVRLIYMERKVFSYNMTDGDEIEIVPKK